MSEKARKNLVLVIVVVIVIVLIYIATVGQVDLSSPDNESNERLSDEEKQRMAAEEHLRLETALSEKKSRKRKLDRLVSIGYFCVRLICVGLIAAYNFALYEYIELRSFGEFVQWNNGALLLMAIAIFLFFKRPKNLLMIIGSLHTRIENYVYGNYGGLDGEIEEIERELSIVELKV